MKWSMLFSKSKKSSKQNSFTYRNSKRSFNNYKETPKEPKKEPRIFKTQFFPTMKESVIEENIYGKEA
jgi:hypothetical protein